MTHSQFTSTTARSGTTTESIFRTIERNAGRLQVLRYATYGLEHVTGREAGCLNWIIDDIVADLENLGENVETALKESDNPAAEEEGEEKRT